MTKIEHYILTGGRPNTMEIRIRLHKINQYVKKNPSAKPADIRMELFETTHMIRKYFKTIKECGKID